MSRILKRSFAVVLCMVLVLGALSTGEPAEIAEARTIFDIENELKANKDYSLELIHGVAVGESSAPAAGTFNEYGIYHVYYDWWAPIYYQDE